MRRHSWVGTIDQVVTRWRAVSARWTVSSHRPGGGTTSVMPQVTALTSWPSSPDMWNSGAEAMTAGGCPAPAGVDPGAPSRRTSVVAADDQQKWMTLRCDSTAPFGRPVVPLVKMIVAGSSSSTAMSSAPSGAGAGPDSRSGERQRGPVADRERRVGRRPGVGHLVVGPGGVEHRGDSATGHGAEGDEAVVERRPSRHRHPIAPSDPGGGQPGGGVPHPVRQLGEGDRALALDQERPVSVAGRRVDHGRDRPRALGEHRQPRPEDGLLDQLEEPAGPEESRERVGIERVAFGPPQAGHVNCGSIR